MTQKVNLSTFILLEFSHIIRKSVPLKFSYPFMNRSFDYNGLLDAIFRLQNMKSHCLLEYTSLVQMQLEDERIQKESATALISDSVNYHI